MATGNVTHWCRDGKTRFAAEESNDQPFSFCDADDVWGVDDPKDLYNPAIPTIEKVLEEDERRLEAFYIADIENERRLEALDEAIDKYGNNWQDYICQEGIRQRQYASLREGAMSTFMTAANNARMRRNNDSLQDNGDTHFGDNNDNDCTSLASMTSHRIRRKKRDRQKMRINKDDLHNSGDTHFGDNNDYDCTSLASMTSHSSLAGSNSPSNDIGKSADSEGVVQCLLYPDSTGAAVTPPEVDSLVGGKRKSGKSRNRKKRKKVRSNNHNVKGGCRVVNTPLTNEPEQRDCMERALHSLLTPKEKEMVISEPFPLPSDHGGDVSIAISNMWLMKYGMMLEPVTSRYDTKKGGLLYNLLQDLESRLVIKVVLTMCDGGIADHFIAYDGTTLHDVPHSIKPLRDDRRKKRNCLAIFKKLYPTKNYLAFQVTNVFELCTVKN